MQCSHCQAENSTGARFCSNCGALLPLRCSNCESLLAKGANFCNYCGQAVHTQSAADVARHSRLVAAAPEDLVDKVQAAPLSGERRIVTVLFADVVGSTNLSQQIDDKTWIEIINGAFDRILPAIYRFEGTIARTLGDAMIAFFGAPVAHEDDPYRAVRAALESRKSILTYSEQIRQQYGIDFLMRFCLNTGPIVVGPVDHELKYEFTASNNVVNLATLLKFSAPPMSILVSENTYRFVAPFFECEDLGEVEVKDPGRMMHVSSILGVKTEPGSIRGITGLYSSMVGRDRELESLINLYAAVYSGIGRVAVILGEPGLGKTRLISEWETEISNLGRLPAPLWAEGRCLSYGQGMAYHLIVELLQALLGVTDAADKAQVDAALKASLRDRFGELFQAPAIDVYASLGTLLGLELENEARQVIEILDPQARQAQYITSLRKYLVALTQDRPLVLVIEDLHWSDPSSVDILTNLLSLVGTIPVLFCLVSRLERDAPGWQLVSIARELFGNSLTEIYLEPLSERESRTLVANLLEIEALPETIRSMILSKAEGNPLFVEEVVRMLIERGALVNRGSDWFVEEGIEDLQIPNNLQGLLMARIDRLSEEGKHTLRVASVVGRRFPVKVLRNVLVRQARIDEFNRLEPLGVLTNLESTGLIRVAQYEPDLEYLFRHSLVQDAAYDSILLADRRKLHLMVGETVEQFYPELVSSRELAPRLGQHFSEAGDAERAIKYYSLAGQAALASFANQEAADFFQKGLSLTSAIPERIKLLSGLGEAINNQSRYLEAIETWREAIRLAGSIMDLPTLARLYSWAARAAWWAENTPLSLELCLEGIRSAADSSPSPEKALLIHETARAYYFNGVPTQAKSYCLQSLEMAEDLGDIAVQAESLTTLAILHNQDPKISENALKQAINLAESAGLLRIASRAHINAGSMRRGLFGDMEGALFHYKKSLEIAQRRGVIKEQLFSLGAILSIYLDLGELYKLQEMQPQFEELIQSLTDQRLARQELNRFQVIIQIMRGEWIEASDSIFFLAEEVRKTGNLRGLIDICLVCTSGAIEANWMGESIDWWQLERKIDEVLELCDRGLGNKAGPLANLSIIRVIQGRLEEARQILQQAEDATGERDDIWIFSLLWYAKGILAAAERSWEIAFDDFEQAYHSVTRSGQRWTGGKVLLRWADALVQRGEPADLDRALGLLREAVALFESMQAPIYLGFIEQQRKKCRKRMLVQATDQIGIAREMTQAGLIQRGFLPDQLPDLPGWSLAAVLVPARETSGDYYDFIPLPDSRLGIVIADVTDKGAGAALFMASSRTLIRTYSEEFPGEPARVLEHTNHRLLRDTHAGLFVTMFYAVLDPAEGTIQYCNAGHNPPFIFNADAAGQPASLTKTGVPLGILDGEVWETGILDMQIGDWLVLYTDGVTEAQNVDGEYYEERRIQAFFMEALKKGNADQLNAVQLLAAQVEDLQDFIGSAPHSDDLTMIVIGRI